MERVTGTVEVDGKVQHQPSRFQDDDAVGQFHRFVHVVRDEEHGGTVSRDEVQQERVHPNAGQRVESTERFVGEQ